MKHFEITAKMKISNLIDISSILVFIFLMFIKLKSKWVTLIEI